jgi:hypothetical protein
MYLYLYSNEFIWGTKSISPELIDKNNIDFLLNYFNVASIITTHDFSEKLDRNGVIVGFQEVSQFGEKNKFLWMDLNKNYVSLPIYEYMTNPTIPINVLTFNPIIFNGEDGAWQDYATNFLLNNNSVLIKVPKNYSLNNLDFNIADAKLKNFNISKNEISFFVESDQNVPILIKKSYFPNWKAYSNGNEIDLFVAAPNQMLIFGKGQINLKFELTLVELIPMYISIFSLIIIIGYFFKIRFLKLKF